MTTCNMPALMQEVTRIQGLMINSMFTTIEVICMSQCAVPLFEPVFLTSRGTFRGMRTSHIRRTRRRIITDATSGSAGRQRVSAPTGTINDCLETLPCNWGFRLLGHGEYGLAVPATFVTAFAKPGTAGTNPMIVLLNFITNELH